MFEELIPDELKKMMEEMERLLDKMPREKMQNMLQNMKKNNIPLRLPGSKTPVDTIAPTAMTPSIDAGNATLVCVPS